jgi:dephospho-CoA kinase
MADQSLTQPRQARPLIVGMTGNIATGKSTVLAYLAGLGAWVIDADRLAHSAMEPGGPAYAGVIAEFGSALVRADGLIDRQRLGQIVFAEPAKLQALEKLVHPAVFALAQQEVRQATAAGAPVIIIEAIKLLESGRLVSLCDEIWVVTAPETAQLARMMRTVACARKMPGDAWPPNRRRRRKLPAPTV